MRIRIPADDVDFIDRARSLNASSRSHFMVSAAIARAEAILIEQAHRRQAKILLFPVARSSDNQL